MPPDNPTAGANGIHDRRVTDALWLLDALQDLPEPVWLDATAVGQKKGTKAAQAITMIRNMKLRYPTLSIVCSQSKGGRRNSDRKSADGGFVNDGARDDGEKHVGKTRSSKKKEEEDTEVGSSGAGQKVKETVGKIKKGKAQTGRKSGAQRKSKETVDLTGETSAADDKEGNVAQVVADWFLNETEVEEDDTEKNAKSDKLRVGFEVDVEKNKSEHDSEEDVGEVAFRKADRNAEQASRAASNKSSQFLKRKRSLTPMSEQSDNSRELSPSPPQRNTTYTVPATSEGTSKYVRLEDIETIVVKHNGVNTDHPPKKKQSFGHIESSEEIVSASSKDQNGYSACVGSGSASPDAPAKPDQTKPEFIIKYRGPSVVDDENEESD